MEADDDPANAPTTSTRRSRGSENAQIIVISWRDIPAQVNAQKGRERHQVILSGKFQRAIDRAKRKGKIYTAHEDIAQWNRISRPCVGDLAQEAQQEADRIEAKYSKEHLGRLGFLGGWEPHNLPADANLNEGSPDGSGTDGADEEEDDLPEDSTPEDVNDWGTWSSKPDEQHNPLGSETDSNASTTDTKAGIA